MEEVSAQPVEEVRTQPISTQPISTPQVSTPPVSTPPVSSTRPLPTPPLDTPPERCMKPATPGKSGREIEVRTNFYPLTFPDTCPLHLYTVEILPAVSNRDRCTVFNKFLRVHRRHLKIGRTAYNGNHLFTRNEVLGFPIDQGVWVTFKDEKGLNRSNMFNVRIEAGNINNLKQLVEISVGVNLEHNVSMLNLVLRRLFSTRVTSGPYISNQSVQLAEGLEAFAGSFQSIRATQAGAILNIDSLYAVFYKPAIVTDFLELHFPNLDLATADQNTEVINLLTGLKIGCFVGSPVQTFKIEALKKYTGDKLKLTDNEMKTRLPEIAIWDGEELVWLAMEECTISNGQKYANNLSAANKENLSSLACVTPFEREKRINEVVGEMRVRGAPRAPKTLTDILGNSGIIVDPNALLANARVLDDPELKFNKGTCYPCKGKWDMEHRQVLDGVQDQPWHWGCINLSLLPTDSVTNFFRNITARSINLGMGIFTEDHIVFSTGDPGNVRELLKQAHSAAIELYPTAKKQLFLLIILPEIPNASTYKTIKQVCETELGILSQCIRHNKLAGSLLPKQENEFLGSLCLKINLKVGGRTISLGKTIPEIIPNHQPTIIFGADVSHPVPGDSARPSIAAVVSTVDWPAMIRYASRIYAQPNNSEIIVNLEEMVRNLMETFRKITELIPRRIVFYRDGVGNSQFDEVVAKEVGAIWKACRSLGETYRPPITYVVVQKRHHTRFFCDDSTSSGNVPAGTVVDSQVCHPTDFDFYLNSHYGTKGTSKSAHYTVLCDENEFTVDEVERLTYDLCYTYAKLTTATPIVPPVLYAHNAAARGQVYVNSSRAPSTSGGFYPLLALNDNVKNEMFFC